MIHRSDYHKPVVADTAFPAQTTATALIVLVITACAAGQAPEWLLVTPSARFRHAMAYDSRRHVCVMFGGLGNPTSDGATWELHGDSWHVRSATGPGPRLGHAMTFDSSRGQTVLFGGQVSSQNVGDTWTWDGTRWERHDAPGPGARNGHAMAFDPVRGVTVLFGGIDGVFLGDTWEWNGNAWTRRSTEGPAPRADHAMEFDRVRGKIVLFGGWDSPQSRRDDTWEWGGRKWEHRAERSPAARSGHTMTFDAARNATVLHAGYGRRDTWEWDGIKWSLRCDTGPDVGSNAAMAFDEQARRAVVFGGYRGVLFSDTWAWDGKTWRTINPTPYFKYTLQTHDEARGETVLFEGATPAGGMRPAARTWTWNGRTWSLRTENGPPGRRDAAIAYDTRRKVVTLYGGRTSAGMAGDTWEWDGETWTKRSEDGPPPRAYHAMAFDGRRGETVLFGGTTAQGNSDETWEWNGERWAERPREPGSWPAPTLYHFMAFDRNRGVTVKFGGLPSEPTGSSNVWEWDGVHWDRIVAHGPGSGWRNLGLVYDNRRCATFLFLGNGSPWDAWEWNGKAWKQIGPTGPTTWKGFTMSFDTVRGVSVLNFAARLGGSSETWEYGLLLPGDMNGDGRVSPDDLPPFIEASLSPGVIGSTQHRRADLNGSGIIDGEDLRLFIAALLQ